MPKRRALAALPPDRVSAGWTIASAITLAVLCLVAFWNAFPAEMVYDAVPMVQENPLLREESPGGGSS